MISTTRKGKTIGVNRDGDPVGHATLASRKNQPERWTAFVYLVDPPYDAVATGFDSADTAVAYIGLHGETPDHLKVAPMREP